MTKGSFFCILRISLYAKGDIMQRTIRLFFVLMMSTLLNASTNWAPVVMGDITMFMPYTTKPIINTVISQYSPNATVSITISGELSGDRDWAGVYRVGDNNDWANVIAWNWVSNGTTELNLNQKPMPAGEYEIRLFFHNSYHMEAVYRFRVVENHTFGHAGTHAVSTHTEVADGNSIVYYPSDIAQMPKTPLIFFCPGFGNQNHVSYKSLLTFIASHGYSVIYAKDYYGDPNTFIKRFEKMLDNNNDVLPHVDTTRIGVIGHSSGGGDTFKILDHFSKKGYGANGRFLMSLDGWFAFGMNSDQMRNLPSNTNVVIQRYEHPTHPNTQDPRITLSEYALLDSIANNKKDYQVYNPATHGYPGGSRAYTDMQGLLKPLDALMAVTFKGEENAHDTALENGSDTPYEDGLEDVREIWRYAYRCNSHKNRAEVMEIDYCHEYNQPKVYPADTIFDDKTQANVAKPNYLDSYVDPVFGNKVTRITDRANQTGNSKPYPKTQVWNADQTLIRLGYRIYYSDNFSETPITTNTLIRGSLTEMKWSSYEPDVFYGIDIRWDRFVFVKAKINSDHTITYTDMPNATFMKSEYDELLLGKYEGNLDFQDNYVVFAGRKKDTNRVTLIVYHLKNNYGTTYNSIVSNVTTDMKWYVEDANGNFTTSGANSNQMFDWASISALGNYVIVNYRSKKGDPAQEYSIEQYDRHINHIRRLAEHGNHGDLGVDANGKEVYVQFGFGTEEGIWMYPLDGSPRTQLLPDKYNGGHVSCRNYKRPGWCYLNTRYLWNGAGVREVFALKLDDSHTVERFAQTHTSIQNSECVQVNVSPDGTQILFNSDWNSGSQADYQWDADHYMSCSNSERKIKIDTYHVKVGE